MAKLPSFQFYPGDWTKDFALRFASLSARGLLVDLLCLCFEAPRRGVLTKADGITPLSDEEIADAVAGSTRQEKLAALRELEERGVLSRDDNGCLYSRRMVRDEDIRVKKQTAGSKGGSKTQAKRQAKPQANDQANDQAKTGSSSSSSASAINTPLPPLSDTPLNFDLIRLPPGFDSPETREAAQRWIAWRATRPKPPTDPELTIATAAKLFKTRADFIHNLNLAYTNRWDSLRNFEQAPSHDSQPEHRATFTRRNPRPASATGS